MSTAGEGRSSNSDGRAWISWIGQYYWRNEVGSMIEFEFEFKISAVCLTAESACENLCRSTVPSQWPFSNSRKENPHKELVLMIRRPFQIREKMNSNSIKELVQNLRGRLSVVVYHIYY